ncbi:zinc finger, CCHC-type containing protein [Tanacetum coccineum]
MFMLNLNKVLDDSDSVYMSSSSTVVNSSLWHARLGHVHYKRMVEMDKDDLIPTINENLEKCLSEGFWGEAMLMACYLLNKGCRAVIRLPDPKRKTLGEKGIDCIFVGYAEHFKAYRDDHSNNVPSETHEPRKEEDPRTYDEAMQSRDAAFWKKAINDEIGSIMENNTWVLFDLPTGCKPLGCKWIFKRKMKVDGTIDKFKARLVIQAIHNLVIHQMDVKTAFLNGDLDEEVYMKQPEGFVMPGNEHKVCNLVKSLYGLKQAPKQWHQKFDEVVLSSGFHLNQFNKCVYSKFDDSGKGVIICLYVDDMLIFGTDQNQVDKTKKFLSSRFSMKDMGEADVILDIKIKHENKGIVIMQSHYIEKILKKFNRKDFSPVSTPMDPVEKLKPNTPKAYSDASWINHVEDSSSISGWVFLHRGGAISWDFKKQTCITGSTMEFEFVALAAVGKEVEWLKNLIHEIPIWPKPIAPISIGCDSAPTMARAYSQIYNGKSRHLGVRHSMVRKLIRNGVISIKFVRTQHNLAAHLMNGLARDLVYKSVIRMGLKSI